MDGPIRRLGRFLGLDHNPLRRPIDRAEAWIRLLLVAVLVVGGPVLTITLATRIHHDMATRAAVEQAEFHQVTAVIEDAAGPAAAADSIRRFATATVHLSGGTTRRVRVSVPTTTAPGQRVPVWVNAHGQVVQQPLTSSDAAFTTILAAVMTPALLAAALWLIGVGIRVATIRAAGPAWEWEWRLITNQANGPGD